MRKTTKDAIDHWFNFSVCTETRTIYLGDQEDHGENLAVGPTMAEFAIKGIHLFNRNPRKPIKILLNSLGGCEFNGMGIYDAIKTSPCKVTIDAIGPAMSMGSIILQAGDVRRAYANTIIMIHDGYLASDAVIPTTFEAWAEYSKKVSRPVMYNIYAERSGKPANYWKKRCASDYILTAQDALEEGLIDEIIT